MLTEVDYRTGRWHDVQKITERAHKAGALVIWDLAHSAGALPVDVTGHDIDFAVGCTYKYLNGGPGSPAFIYIKPELVETVDPILSGWLGHAQPFEFDLNYTPASGVERMRVGTPPIVALSVLDAALDVWKTVDMQDVRAESIRLGDYFISQCDQFGNELRLMSPREGLLRGSQVSYAHKHSFEIIHLLTGEVNITDLVFSIDHRQPRPAEH